MSSLASFVSLGSAFVSLTSSPGLALLLKTSSSLTSARSHDAWNSPPWRFPQKTSSRCSAASSPFSNVPSSASVSSASDRGREKVSVPPIQEEERRQEMLSH